MKGEKGKLILVYILMFLVIGLIIALTFVILNNKPEEKQQESTANDTPTVDVNPYPNISEECTFNLTMDEYNALTGPRCKNGYSRYNVTGLNIGGKSINISIIYTDIDGNKAGIYVNDRRATTKIDNLSNIKFGVFDDKIFILDNNNSESNVLVYSSDAIQLYNLKETLDSAKISDPAFQNLSDPVISSKTIDPNSFNFTATNFTFKTQTLDNSNQVVAGSTYQVTFTGNEFSKPEFVNMN